MLTDKFGRQMTYLRLGVTDVCNLCCYYCMPKNPMFTPKKLILSDVEIRRLVGIFLDLGITKIRITGGEPFARPDLMNLLTDIKKAPRLRQLNITTNATLITPYLDEILTLFDEITISLDSLKPARFEQIRGKNQLKVVWGSLEYLWSRGMKIKLNMVVLPENKANILLMLELTQNPQIQVRFIEQMPFNGGKNQILKPTWNDVQILEFISQNYTFHAVTDFSKNETATYYQIENYQGKFGIIPAFSRTFCGSCNRVRVNAKGELRTCLYAQKNVNLLELLRNGTSNEWIREIILDAVKHKAKDGWQATQKVEPRYESMHILGG